MTYALSFGPDFFRRSHSAGHLVLDDTALPTSVEQAVLHLSRDTWRRLARDIFGCRPEFLSVDTVLKRIDETNTCLNLDSPVQVCVDPNADFTVLVYDRQNP